MKKFISKFTGIFAAGLMVFSLGACANDSGSSGGSSSVVSRDDYSGTLAVYENSQKDSGKKVISADGKAITYSSDHNGTIVIHEDGIQFKNERAFVLRFYENTFTAIDYYKEWLEGKLAKDEAEAYCSGTYKIVSGDFKNGRIYYKVTKHKDYDYHYESDGYITITNGKFDISFAYRSQTCTLVYGGNSVPENSDANPANTDTSSVTIENSAFTYASRINYTKQ